MTVSRRACVPCCCFNNQHSAENSKMQISTGPFSEIDKGSFFKGQWTDQRRGGISLWDDAITRNEVLLQGLHGQLTVPGE